PAPDTGADRRNLIGGYGDHASLGRPNADHVPYGAVPARSGTGVGAYDGHRTDRRPYTEILGQERRQIRLRTRRPTGHPEPASRERPPPIRHLSADPPC